MRRSLFQFGSGLEEKRLENPWRRRMPTQKYIGRKKNRFNTTDPKPVTFGKRSERPDTVIETRRFSFARLAGLFQGPRNTRRTKLR